MRFLILLTIVSVIGLIGHCSQQEAGDNSDSNDSIFQSYEFPSHPHLTHLCQQRVNGSGHEITWDAFASLPSRRSLWTTIIRNWEMLDLPEKVRAPRGGFPLMLLARIES